MSKFLCPEHGVTTWVDTFSCASCKHVYRAAQMPHRCVECREELVRDPKRREPPTKGSRMRPMLYTARRTCPLCWEKLEAEQTKRAAERRVPS